MNYGTVAITAPIAGHIYTCLGCATTAPCVIREVQSLEMSRGFDPKDPEFEGAAFVVTQSAPPLKWEQIDLARSYASNQQSYACPKCAPRIKHDLREALASALYLLSLPKGRQRSAHLQTIIANQELPTHATIGLSLFRELVLGSNALRQLDVFRCNVKSGGHGDGCECFWEQCDEWATNDVAGERPAGGRP